MDRLVATGGERRRKISSINLESRFQTNLRRNGFFQRLSRHGPGLSHYSRERDRIAARAPERRSRQSQKEKREGQGRGREKARGQESRIKRREGEEAGFRQGRY